MYAFYSSSENLACKVNIQNNNLKWVELMAWGRERQAGSVTECGEAVGRAQKGVSALNTYIPLHL